MRIILKGAVFLLSLILCFIIIARIAAAPAKEKPVEDTYNDASSTVSISPIETVLEPSPPDEEPEQVEEENAKVIADFVRNVNNFNVIYLLTQDVYITKDQAEAGN